MEKQHKAYYLGYGILKTSNIGYAYEVYNVSINSQSITFITSSLPDSPAQISSS